MVKQVQPASYVVCPGLTSQLKNWLFGMIMCMVMSVPPSNCHDRGLKLHHNLLPFTSSLIHYSLIIPLFNAI